MSNGVNRLGFIYILEREDLKRAYVGQSIHRGRPYKHLKEGAYQYTALCSDGVFPRISILEDEIPQGLELDQKERFYMREVQSRKGWELVNILGPDVYFPSYGSLGAEGLKNKRESNENFNEKFLEKLSYARKVWQANRQKLLKDENSELRQKEIERGRQLGSYTKNRRKTDPEFSEKMDQVFQYVGNLTKIKFETDPGFEQEVRDRLKKANEKAIQNKKDLRETSEEFRKKELNNILSVVENRMAREKEDPEFASKMFAARSNVGIKQVKELNKKNKKCTDSTCDYKISTISGIKHHQKKTGHTGIETVEVS